MYGDSLKLLLRLTVGVALAAGLIVGVLVGCGLMRL
jgi:hypothetical protein